MSPDPDRDTLAQWFALARDGDRVAAGRLMSNFEPEIRRFVRFRLASSGIRRVVDSVDIAQSVFARFFVFLQGAADNIEDVEQLRRYLLAAAQHALIDRTRRDLASRRDIRRTVAAQPQVMEGLADPSDAPSDNLEKRELIALIRERLTSEELTLLDQWLSGRPWDDVAREAGRPPDALRKQMGRALDRAAHDLNLLC